MIEKSEGGGRNKIPCSHPVLFWLFYCETYYHQRAKGTAQYKLYHFVSGWHSFLNQVPKLNNNSVSFLKLLNKFTNGCIWKSKIRFDHKFSKLFHSQCKIIKTFLFKWIWTQLNVYTIIRIHSFLRFPLEHFQISQYYFLFMWISVCGTLLFYSLSIQDNANGR